MIFCHCNIVFLSFCTSTTLMLYSFFEGEYNHVLALDAQQLSPRTTSSFRSNPSIQKEHLAKN
ncbi:hypothetical protein AAHE18_13G143400 [Arachis hypogaea]